MDSNAIIHLASRLRARANEIIAQELAQRGIRGLAPSHGAILVQLYRHGPLPMQRLAQLIGRKKNTVTTLARKLETLGYLERQADPQDSRVSLLALTPQGRAFQPVMDQISRAVLARLWGSMPQEQRQALADGLGQLIENLG